MSYNAQFKNLCCINVIVMVLMLQGTNLAQEIERSKAKLKGRVLNIDKVPIPNAKIELKQDDVGQVFHYTSNAKGEFCSDIVSPGKYKLKIESEDYESYEGRIQLHPDVIKELDIILAQEQTLEQKLGKEALLNFKKGLDLTEDNKINEAIEIYQKVIEQSPDFAEAYQNLGILLFQLQKDDEAEKVLLRALELRPQEEKTKKILTEIYYEKARTSIRADKTKEALVILERAHSLNPEHAYVNYLLGYLYFNLQMRNEAIKYFEAYLRLDPESPNVEKVKDALKRLKK